MRQKTQLCVTHRGLKKHATRTGRNMCFLLPCPAPSLAASVCVCVYMICGSSTNATSGKRNLRNRNRKFCDGQLRCRGRCHRPGLTDCLPHSLPACHTVPGCLPHSAWLPLPDTDLMDARRSLSLSCRILDATFDFDFRAQFMHLSADSYTTPPVHLPPPFSRPLQCCA